MKDWQDRVVAEKVELDEKLNKLNIFIGGDVFAALDSIEQGRLYLQRFLMEAYSEVLGERIAAFPKD